MMINTTLTSIAFICR